MEKVTEQLERGDREVLDQIERAVRSVHGELDRDLEQEAYLRTLEVFRRARSVHHPKAQRAWKRRWAKTGVSRLRVVQRGLASA